ncbi:alpha/beta hydrolase fold family [Colletotrichum tofieldiae]|uniref:Alpha/beta hydrolase fold family n=1 Tax=Colletotrichum tofieldiae TaxID=708197 RepID=A0A166S8C9_9PEZI|nr:alpha/beta hydrolase fold family [Colletotrichum tofieldiae]GKT56152.1 alpha/beta hydrolase fold family [Colletotrichum tofieldiae]GKT81511.1 alpha/beta hydrolase fold family [Colletotrichum tofieldiae]GKT82170.1 alpha/beta hydrolase fold family [Colletotrichum tofieldiae]
MLVGKSVPELILVRSMVVFFQYLGLLCFLYFWFIFALAGVPGIAHPVSIIIEVVGAIEILFYFVWFVPYRSRLQKPGFQPTPLSREERNRFFHQGLDHAPDVEQYIRRWHCNAQLGDIRRENVKDWLLWALFDKQGHPGEHEEELEEYIADAEERAGITIKGGFGDSTPMRLSFDPINITHRSLLFYLITGWLDFFATLVLFIRGFKFYRQPRNTFFSVFPWRPMTLLSPNESADPKLSYFCRPHTSTTQRPILFMHGVGVGMLPYLLWLWSIPKDVGVLAIEILPVSSRICPPLQTTKELVDGMDAIIEQQSYNDFVFVGNSFGTLLASPLLQRPDIAAKINSVVLIDPVSLLLHLPSVAYNFTRRQPRWGNEWEIWFVATDPMVAHTLARRFRWQDFILWTPQLHGKRTTVVLGGEDCVTDPDAVASYVYFGDLNYTRHDKLEWATTPERWTGRGELELMYLDGMDHGQAFLSIRHMPQIGNVVLAYTHLNGVMDSRQADAAKEEELNQI